MNYDIWFLFEQFRSLSVGGKIAFVCGHILVLLLIILCETHREQRQNAKRSPTAIPCSIIEPAEKLIHTISTCPQKGNLRNAHKRLAYLLETFRNSLGKYQLHYQSKINGDSPTHQFQRHIRDIVNKLRRGVNQSGKEPAAWLPLERIVKIVVCGTLMH